MAQTKGVRGWELSQLPCGPLGYLISPNNFRNPGARRTGGGGAPSGGVGILLRREAAREPGREGAGGGRVTLPRESSERSESIVAQQWSTYQLPSPGEAGQPALTGKGVGVGAEAATPIPARVRMRPCTTQTRLERTQGTQKKPGVRG